MFCLELMLYWGLDYEQFNAQPLALINRLFLLHQVKPFLPSTSWIQSGTIASAVYNTQRTKKNKPLGYEDVYPFLKKHQEVDIMDGWDEEAQVELHAKLGAIFG